ncbi:MAG: MBL fold metallo-hydrolase [Candidatus Nanoarchaeia archaeon]
MQDKIIFLGTGGGRVVIANQLAATGGFVIQLEGYQIWVDPGPGALVRARQYGVRAGKTDIIYVSHEHIDHSNDINAVIDAMTLGGIRKRGIVISTQSVINGGPESGPVLLPFYKNVLKEVFAIRTNDKIKIGPLTFIATPTKHDVETNGLRLETDKVTIGYTGNTAPTPELAEALKGCNILIIDVLKPGKEMWKNHFCSEDAANLIAQVKPELAIITHFGARMLKFKPVYEAREIQRKTGIRTVAAQDGTRVDLKALATGQKKLEQVV